MNDGTSHDETSPDDDEPSWLVNMGAAVIAALIAVVLVDGVTLGLWWVLRAIHGMT